MPDLRESEAHFAWGLGAGLDVSINPAFAFRLLQVDYIAEQSDPIRRHYRVAIGLVGTFGLRD